MMVVIVFVFFSFLRLSFRSDVHLIRFSVSGVPNNLRNDLVEYLRQTIIWTSPCPPRVLLPTNSWLLRPAKA